MFEFSYLYNKKIFEGKKHETYTGLSSDLSENTVFVDYHSLDTKRSIE